MSVVIFIIAIVYLLLTYWNKLNVCKYTCMSRAAGNSLEGHPWSWSYLQLPMQSVPITTKVVRSILGCFLFCVLRFPPPLKLTSTI